MRCSCPCRLKMQITASLKMQITASFNDVGGSSQQLLWDARLFACSWKSSLTVTANETRLGISLVWLTVNDLDILCFFVFTEYTYSKPK